MGDGSLRSPGFLAVPARDGSNSLESVVNLVKVCIGTGALALPFAVSEGGIAVGTLGLLFIAAWNLYASYRLDMLRDWTGTSTYASLAEVVLGPWARMLVDVCTISTLLGVCVVYTITFATLVHATPMSLAPGSLSIWRETVLCGALVLPLSCSPHLKFLANTSAVGLLALVAGFVAISVYGVQEFGWTGTDGAVGHEPSTLSSLPAETSSSLPPLLDSMGPIGGVGYVHAADDDDCATVNWGPSSPGHFANWFGVAAFCYGVPPLQFSLQDALAYPHMFTTYLGWALLLVFVLYTIGGTGIAWLYRCDPHGIQENVLSNLPDGSWFANTVRLCYAIVCVTSFPLCLVPMSGMAKPIIRQLAGGLAQWWDDTCPRRYGAVESGGGDGVSGGEGGWWSGVLLNSDVPLRASAVVLTTCIAVAFPHFGLIVAIIGSFSVTLTSFVLPSLMALSCAADSTGVTQRGHKPWMSAPQHINNADAPTSSSSSSNNNNNSSYRSSSSSPLAEPQQPYGSGSGGGGGGAPSEGAFPSRGNSSPNRHHRLNTNSSADLLTDAESQSMAVVGNTPCRPAGREMNGFGADASPWWWWVDVSALVLGVLTCVVTTSLTLFVSK